MARETDNFMLRGGLDLVTSPLAVKPGRLWTAINYEPVEAGYRRLRGFERKDGRPSPSEGIYFIVPVNLLPGHILARPGETIMNMAGDKSAVVLALTDDGDYVIGEMETGALFAEDDVLTIMRAIRDNALTWQGEALIWQNEVLTWQ